MATAASERPPSFADPFEEEEDHDRTTLEDGAEDSDEEEDNGNFVLEQKIERNKELDSNVAAEVSEADYIEATGNPDECGCIPGAPLGWKKPGPPDDWVPGPP